MHFAFTSENVEGCQLQVIQRVKAFREWVANLPPGPGLSDYDVSRDSIYE